jgi:hypothetical protein
LTKAFSRREERTVPLTLNVGVSKKLGLPEYSSVGATCGVQVELDPALLEHDLEGFHERVRAAYVACHQAVHDELARLQQHTNTPAESRRAPATNAGPDGPANREGHGRPRKPATANQVRAIAALARRHGLELADWLRAGYGVEQAEDLTLSEASRLIDELKATSLA